MFLVFLIFILILSLILFIIVLNSYFKSFNPFNCKLLFNYKLLTIFCINLPESVDRKLNILNNFPTSMFNIVFVDAIDTRNGKWRLYNELIHPLAILRLEESLKNKYRHTHGDFTEGAVGCFLSHLKCMNNMTEPYRIIIEDDTVFKYPVYKVYHFILKFLSKIPDDADFIFFSYKASLNRIDNFWSILSPGSIFYCMDFYLVTKKGAQRFLEIIQKRRLVHQIDTFLSLLYHDKQISLYFSNIKIARQMNSKFPSIIKHLPVK